MRWDRKMGSSEEGWQSQMSHTKGQSIQSQSPLRKLRILYCIGESHYPLYNGKFSPYLQIPHLLFVCVDQLPVISVLQFPWGLGNGQGGVEYKQLPCTFGSLGKKRRLLVHSFLYSSIIHSSPPLSFLQCQLCQAGGITGEPSITEETGVVSQGVHWPEENKADEVAGDASLTFSASIPAWITGANTVSVSLVSANISGI